MKTDREKAIEEADQLLMRLPLAGTSLLAFGMALYGSPYTVPLIMGLILASIARRMA